MVGNAEVIRKPFSASSSRSRNGPEGRKRECDDIHKSVYNRCFREADHPRNSHLHFVSEIAYLSPRVPAVLT
jgi:hypothetical protein